MIIKAGIVGATGYAGQSLVDILLHHPQVRISGLYSTTDEPRPFAQVCPRFAGLVPLSVKKFTVKDLIASADVAFLALPHTASMTVVPALLKAGKRVIDLSADYRLKDSTTYARAYGLEHKDKQNIARSVYGLPELYRQKIGKARLVANPGCYPTGAILGLAPLAAIHGKDILSVYIDAKSGASGAGKKAVQEMLFTEVDEDFRAYKVNTHQHLPEIAQELSHLAGRKQKPVFVPHLLPLKSGILETIYVRIRAPRAMTTRSVIALYKKFYQREPFVRIREKGQFPALKDVAGSNFCDIGLQADGDDIIVIVALDNLIKGAAGQAVQNLNIMFGFPETTALV